MKEYETDENFTSEEPSKSELKRQMHERQQLGEKLAKLRPAQLATIPLDSLLQEAIADYQRFTHREAKRRQMQFIGKLMREVDIQAVEQAWQLTQGGSEASKKIQHKLEYWRDTLIADGDVAVSAALEEFARLDRQRVRQLVRDAHKEQRENKPPAASRKLFQYLKTVLATDSDSIGDSV